MPLFSGIVRGQDKRLAQLLRDTKVDEEVSSSPSSVVILLLLLLLRYLGETARHFRVQALWRPLPSGQQVNGVLMGPPVQPHGSHHAPNGGAGTLRDLVEDDAERRLQLP